MNFREKEQTGPGEKSEKFLQVKKRPEIRRKGKIPENQNFSEKSTGKKDFWKKREKGRENQDSFRKKEEAE